MRTIAILIVAVLSNITNCDAQTFSVKDLIGTKWEHVKDYDDNTKTIIEFTDKEIIEYNTHSFSNKTYRFTRPYYLSHLVPTSFDKTKVGKVTEGTYMVILYKNERMNYKTIKKLTSKTLILYRRKVNSIGGHEQTYVYKRIK